LSRRQPWCAGLKLLAHRIAERWRERAERLGGRALILLGSYLVPEQATR